MWQAVLKWVGKVLLGAVAEKAAEELAKTRKTV